MQNFETEFHSVVTSGLKEEQEKSIDVMENGTFEMLPDDKYKVLKSATVNVNVPLKYEEGYSDGYKASQDSITLQEKTVTENGEVVTDEGYTGLSKVTVAVPLKEEQRKSLSVTKNGTYEVLPDEGHVISGVDVDVSVVGDVGKPYIDTSKMNSFESFLANNKLLLADIDKLDTSNGDDFTEMFYNCSKLTSIPQLDTSNGAYFARMFYNCMNLTSIPPLDTSKGMNFAEMFYKCSKLTSIPPLDTSKGTNLGGMFYNCSELITISITTSRADFTADAFRNCTKLTDLSIGEGWAVSIYLNYSNNLTVESLHGMIENLADLTGQTAKTFRVGEANLAKIDAEHLTMLENKNWDYS